MDDRMGCNLDSQICPKPFLLAMIFGFFNSGVPLVEGCYSRLPLGLANGLVTDDQLSASSMYSSDQPYWKAQQARLRNGECWCGAQGNDRWKTDYIQVDLKAAAMVTGIAVQGDPNWAPNYVKGFYVQSRSHSGGTFTDLMDDSNKGPKIFTGNKDNTNIKFNWFLKPVVATSVRVLAKVLFREDDDKHTCLRIELFGCFINDTGQNAIGTSDGIYPLGMEAGTISDKQIKASGSDGGTLTSNARLNHDKSWCVDQGSDTWLEVDLGQPLKIVALSLQGKRERDTKNLIKKFIIRYSDSDDPSKDKYITDGKGRRFEFDGGVVPSTVEFRKFPQPISARRIRLVPLLYSSTSSQFCARMELFGGHPVCNDDLTSLIKDTVLQGYNIGSASSWCNAISSYLNIQFQRDVVISGFAISGDSEEDNWITKYSLSFQDKKSKKAMKIDLKGTFGRTDVAVSWFDKMMVTNSITVLPVTSHGKSCLRFRVIGCSDIVSKARDLKCSASSNSFTLQWLKPKTMPFGLTKYSLYMDGSKSYLPKWRDRVIGDIASNVTQFESERLFTAAKYEISLTSVYSIHRAQAQITCYTLPKAPPVPDLIKMDFYSYLIEETKIYLYGVSSINGPVSHYELIISETEIDINSINSSHLYSQAVASSKNIPYFLGAVYTGKHLPYSVIIKPGVLKLDGIPNVILETFVTYHFYFRAVIAGKDVKEFDPLMRTYVSNSSLVSIDRRSLLELPSNAWGITQTTAIVNLTMQAPPHTTHYQVIAMDITKDMTTHSVHPPNYYRKSYLNTYNKAVGGEPYIAAQITVKDLPQFKSFVLGDELRTSTTHGRFYGNKPPVVFFNGPLEPEHTYIVFQRAYNKKGNYFSSPWSKPFTALKKEGGRKPSTNVAVIATIVPILLLAIVAVLLAYIYWVRKRSDTKREHSHDHPMSYYQNVDDELSKMNNSYEMVSSVEEKKNTEVHAPLGPRPSRALVVPQDPKYPAIPVSALPRYVAERKKDSRHGFTEEFKSIPFGQEFAWEHGQKVFNKAKNRYNNIAAYDHSRVVLPIVDDILGSDYINANYIHGYSSEKEYIAAQGPKPETINDFWRMVWETRPPGIIMLTNLIEKGRKKCEQYWPNSGYREYDDIKVMLMDTDHYADYVIRRFRLVKEETMDNHELYHFHFLSWPDHGVPEYPTSLLSFCRKFRNLLPRSPSFGPTLVHCSAGVGRTGAFIVIDSMLKLISERKIVDVYNYLKVVRTNRIQMVQTEDQYIFIYEALLDHVACGITEVPVSDLMTQMNILKQRDPTTGSSGYDNQFKRLSVITPRIVDHDTKHALKRCNRNKNRFTDILPRDQDRVILSHIGVTDGSDYINALFVNGYREQNAFVATQHPLKNTVDDFWRMVYERNVTSIVMLNTTKEAEEELQPYWPSEKELSIHSLTVKMKEQTVMGDIVTRTILVEHRKDQTSKEVHQYQLTSWLPNSIPGVETVIELLRLVEKTQQSLGNGTVCVHCSDGSSRAGTFIAASIVLERLKVEQLVDVFQVVKRIRLLRPGFVNSVDQYILLHDIALKFVDSFSTYANF